MTDALKSRWHKLRKVSDESPASGKPTHDDVSDFLNGAKQQQQPKEVPPPPPTHLSTRPLLSPRLDVSVAPRWPNAAVATQVFEDEARLPSPLPYPTSRRSSNRKGLSVRFAEDPAEIIGHGGDETREPTIHISKTKHDAARQTRFDREHGQGWRPHEGGAGSPPRRSPRRRAQTKGQDAYSTLAGAGIFADRPPSREDRLTEPPQHSNPALAGRYTSYHSGDTNGEYREMHNHGHNPSSRDTSPSARKMLAPPKLIIPDSTSDTLDDDVRLSEGWTPTQREVSSPSDEQDSESSHRNGAAPQQDQVQGLVCTQGGGEAEPSHASMGHLSPSFNSIWHGQGRTADQRSEHDSRPSSRGSSRTLSPPSSDERILQAGPRHTKLSTSPSLNSRDTPTATSPDTGNVKLSRPEQRFRADSGTTGSISGQGSHESLQKISMQAVNDVGGATVKMARKPVNSRSSSTASSRQIMSVSKEISRRPVGTTNAIGAGKNDAGPMTGSADHLSTVQTINDMSRSSSATSGSAAEDEAVTAAVEFAARTKRMQGVFRLQAQRERPGSDASQRQWLRCALWWLHVGKAGLEQLINSPNAGRGLLEQPHVDIGKSSWIITDMLNDGLLVDGDDSERSKLKHHFQGLCGWMAKHQVLPPEDALIQGQDAGIWISYPAMSPPIAHILSATAQAMSFGATMPFRDTKDYFFYQRLPVTATFDVDGNAMDLACMLSIVRHKSHYRASILVASQSELIDMRVGPPVGGTLTGPTWHDILWNPKASSMEIRLPRGLVLSISMTESNYNKLADILEYTRTIDKSFHPHDGEQLVFSSPLSNAQHWENGKHGTFPSGRVQNSFLGVFELSRDQYHGSKRRQRHSGYRVMLITPTTSRAIGTVSHMFDADHPFFFEVPDASPGGEEYAVVLHSSDSASPWRMLLSFEDKATFTNFSRLITGTFEARHEVVSEPLSLRAFSAVSVSYLGGANDDLAVLKQLRWEGAEPVVRQHEHSTSVLTPRRMVLHHSSGALVDRLDLVPGEFLIRLPVNMQPSIEITRHAQPGLQSSIDRHQTEPSVLARLQKASHALSTTPTLRTLGFSSMADVHAYQEAITGHHVAFDSRPASVSIARKHKIVSLYKKPEATRCRVQVLSRGGYHRVIVYFEDFPVADALVLHVKDGDEVVKMNADKEGRHGVKICDARFTLPSKEGNEEDGDSAGSYPAHVRRRFVDVEGVEEGDEHGDVVVNFEEENQADELLHALPAPSRSTHGGGGGSLRSRFR